MLTTLSTSDTSNSAGRERIRLKGTLLPSLRERREPAEDVTLREMVIGGDEGVTDTEGVELAVSLADGDTDMVAETDFVGETDSDTVTDAETVAEDD